MLVLTRKVGEKVIIDGGIEVIVTKVEGNKVRIGISAPPDVRIDRAELRARQQQFEVEVPEGELVGAGV